MLRTASLRLFAGISAALVALSGIGPAAANEYTPVAYIEGVVTAPAGTRLDQLEVRVYEIQDYLGYKTAPVGADGRYKVPYSWLQYANVKVLGGDTGLADTWYGNVSRQEDATNIPVRGRTVTGVDISVPPGSSISGTISVPPGTDTSALTVVAESEFISPDRGTFPATTRTAGVAPDGSYRIPGLGASTYTVKVQPGTNPLLETWYASGADKEATTAVQVAAGSHKTGIDVTVSKPASLSGTAVFPPGTTPEQGFVTLHSERGNRIAGGTFAADGAFHLPMVPAGTSRLSFGSTGKPLAFGTLWFPAAGELATAEPLTLREGEARTDLRLQMQPAGSITGTVKGTGGAIVGVSLLDSRDRVVSTTRTDATGAYSIGRLGPGAFKVRFGDPGYSHQSAPYMQQFYPGVPEGARSEAAADVIVSAGKVTAGIDAVMTPGAAISGVILDEQGLPLHAHSVNTVSLDGSVEERRAWTDTAGRFTISGLSDGDYILETNFDAYSNSLFPLGHLYSGNVRDRQKAQILSIRNGQPVDAGTLSYSTAGKTPSAAAGKFMPLPPTRIIDTRTRALPVGSGNKFVLEVAGKAGIPADAGAVALNLTVTEPSSYGNVYAAPFGALQPDTSNVNYDEQETVPNYVIVPIEEGRITLGNEGLGTTHLIADVAGYFTGGTAADGGAYQPLTPFRAADSRGTGGTQGGQQFDVQMTGLSKLPADVGAVVVNLTAARVQSWDTGPRTSYGHLTAFASGTPKPATSNVNYDWATGDTPNLAIVPVSADGKISIANTSPGPVGIIVDVMGYFRKAAATTAGSFQSVAPKRLLDTRQTPAPVGAGKDIHVTVAGANTIPAGAKAAMVNLTATEPRSYGHLTAYPAGKALPTTSNVNYNQGQTVANFAVVPIGADGKITIRNTSGGGTHIIVDVVGYILG